MLYEKRDLKRTDITDAINLLTEIKICYRGIRQQKTVFDAIVNDLRKVYRRSPDLFSKMEFHVLQQLINYIESYKNELVFTKTELSKINISNLPTGTVVFHKTKFFVGVVVDSRDKINGSPGDKEYKVFISEREVKLASPAELTILGTSIVSYCLKCKSMKTLFSKKCNKCKWLKCPHCDFCNCYHIKSSLTVENNKPYIKRQSTNKVRKAISLCVNCSKQGKDSCPGPSVADSSYKRQATFCSSFSPRQRNQDF